MSFQTDMAFYRALTLPVEVKDGKIQENPVKEAVKGRIFPTAIAVPEEQLENEPVPYIVITYDGMQSNTFTKDGTEGHFDTVQIGIEAAAADRWELARLMQLIRHHVRRYFESTDDEGDDEIPIDYDLTAGPVAWDELKPCYFQTLRYNCTTFNKNEEP